MLGQQRLTVRSLELRIFIDEDDISINRAHLRAFIVDSKVRGGGVGRKLLMEAMTFVDMQEFEETHL